jgi:hypothetical protein
MLFLVQKLSLLSLPVVLFMMAGTFSLARPGWVITERISGPGFEVSQENTIYIKDNRIKSIEGEHHFIFDLNNWQLTLILPSLEGYWRGTPSEFLEQSAEIALEYLKQELLRADDSDRPYLESLYEDLKMEIGQGSAGVSFIGQLPVEIVMTGRQDVILGYPVNQYVVYSDGIRVEELWLTPGIRLGDVYEYGKFRAFSDEMTWGQIFQDYRSSEQYIHLLKQGLPLRTLEFDIEGLVSVTEAIRIENTDIPASTFQVPAGYKPVTLKESGLLLF